MTREEVLRAHLNHALDRVAHWEGLRSSVDEIVLAFDDHQETDQAKLREIIKEHHPELTFGPPTLTRRLARSALEGWEYIGMKRDPPKGGLTCTLIYQMSPVAPDYPYQVAGYAIGETLANDPIL